MSNGTIELNDRARAVFRMVVESYLASGAPVGSRTVARAGGLNLSPASIRNVMQDLEEAGLLVSPHTSAGRRPTEAGLRLFVDGIMQVNELSAEERAAIEKQIDTEGPIEAALAAASSALSGLSACAGVVMVPKAERRLRQVSLLRLSAEQGLAVLVGEDGSVENRLFPLDRSIPDSVLAEASNYVSSTGGGQTLGDTRREVEQELSAGRAALDEAARDLVARGIATWTQDQEERPVLIVRGQANLIDGEASQDLERVRQLFDELEAMEDIARLLDSAREAEAARIFIGSENKLFSLSGSSVIAAPYRDGAGRVVGVVGVIGPTRLNYGRVVPIVDFTAISLSRLIGRIPSIIEDKT